MIKVPNLDLNRKKGNVVSLIDWFAARRKDQFVGKVSQDTDEGDGLWAVSYTHLTLPTTPYV